MTRKLIKKKVKKGKDKGKTVTKEVKNDSFFNFFSPPALPEDPEAEVDEEVGGSVHQSSSPPCPTVLQFFSPPVLQSPCLPVL